MAKKSEKAAKFEWKGYVNVNITQDQIPALEKLATDEKNVFFSYNAMLTTNYQIKQYYDDYVDGIKTVATCYDSKSPNFGYALSAYADNWYNSLACLIFKHNEVCDGDWLDGNTVTMPKFG